MQGSPTWRGHINSWSHIVEAPSFFNPPSLVFSTFFATHLRPCLRFSNLNETLLLERGPGPRGALPATASRVNGWALGVDHVDISSPAHHQLSPKTPAQHLRMTSSLHGPTDITSTLQGRPLIEPFASSECRLCQGLNNLCGLSGIVQ